MWDVSKDPVPGLIGLAAFCAGIIVIALVCQFIPEQSDGMALVPLSDMIGAVVLLVYGVLSFGIFTDRFARSGNK